MPNSPRVLIPYPSENQDPFYDAFVSMVNAIDAALYAEREDRQIVLMGGGTVTFIVDGGTGAATLTWTLPISISAPLTGFRWEVPSPSPSLVLVEGDAVYVELVRSPTQNITLTALKAPQVPSSNDALLVGIRKGSHFYFRNGRSLANGDSLEILDVTIGTGGSGATDYKTPCRVATTGDVTLVGGAPDTVDGVPLVQDDRVLVWSQALPAENGIYTVQTLGSGSDGTWARATDANTSGLVRAGMVVPVTEGGTYADRIFQLITNNPILVGVTPQIYAIYGSDLATATPETVEAGDAGAVGISSKAAREDHSHPVSTGVIGDVQTVNSGSASAGTSTALARADHKHALQVDVQSAGVTVGSRPTLNFISGATVTDNPGSQRVDVVVAQLGTTGQILRSNIPVALNESTTLTSFEAVGNYSFALNDYTLSGTTVSVNFKACAYVVGGATGEIALYDLTSASTIATLTISSVAPAVQSAVVTLNATAHVYEIRIRVSAGSGSVHAMWTGLEVLNTI